DAPAAAAPAARATRVLPLWSSPPPVSHFRRAVFPAWRLRVVTLSTVWLVLALKVRSISAEPIGRTCFLILLIFNGLNERLGENDRVFLVLQSGDCCNALVKRASTWTVLGVNFASSGNNLTKGDMPHVHSSASFGARTAPSGPGKRDQ